MDDDDDTLPLSALQHYLYCPRRVAVKLVEGWCSANEHIERADIVHERPNCLSASTALGPFCLAHASQNGIIFCVMRSISAAGGV